MTLKNTDIYDITILNRQKTNDSADTIDEKTTGSFCRKNGKSYIMYKSVEDGAETLSTVIVGENEVKIRRRGIVNSEMLCRMGEKTRFMYALPYGNMEMENETLLIENGLSDNGGILHMVYTLYIQGEEYYNDMTIKINKR